MIFEEATEHIRHLRTAFDAAKANLCGDSLIKARLKHMAAVDQYIINLGLDHGAYKENARGMEEDQLLLLINSTIAEHARELKTILQERNWESLAKLGKDTISNAWLLVQHSDHDHQFQAHILKDMAKFAPDQNYAYLFDRVAINSGRPQYYGTQFTKEGAPYPIEDPSGLDERRKQAGLISMAEYSDVMAEQRMRFNR